MPAPFTSFFGDYFHGLWVTWTLNTAGDGFEAEFQANYRARMYTWANGAVDTWVDTARDYDY